MLITLLAMTYVVVCLLCAMVILWPYVAGSRVETRDEAALDKSDLEFQFDHTQWAEKAIH